MIDARSWKKKRAARFGLWFLYVFTAGGVFITGGCGASDGDAEKTANVTYIALAAKVRGLDPGDIGDTTSSAVAAQVFECLYEYHYLKRPYELVPRLAADMPSVSDNGLVYTIKIKSGIYFTPDACFGKKPHKLTAADFVFAWKRIADIKYLSKNWWIFDERIVGLDEFREYTKNCKTAADVDYSRPVEGLQTPDKNTLVIKLKRPWPQITYMLAHLPTAPVPVEAVRYYGKDIVNHPVGTGPFRLAKWHKGSYIELVRNELYRERFYPSEGEESDRQAGFLSDAGKPLPLVDSIVMVIVQEDPPRWFLFLNGKIDASGIPKDNFGEAIDRRGGLTDQMKHRNIHLEVFREPSTYWLGFNMEDEVIGSNRPLRLAISHAVDRQKYIELFTNNRGETALGFIPPLMKSYDPEIRQTAGGYDPARAREFVKMARAAAGGELPRLTLSIPGTDAVSRQQGQFFQHCFEQVGLDITTDYMDWPTFQNKIKTKSAQIFMLGWIADYPDAENFLQLFYSANESPGPNNFNYSNAEFDRIYELASAMPECPERTAMYRQAERIVVEDRPAVFLMHGVAYLLHHDWVHNYKPHAFGYGTAQYRRIDVEQRLRYGR